MSIGRVNFDDISEADLYDLVRASVPEGLVVEYKRDPYGNSDADKKEMLKDISSFANSAGGHLIIGMEETEGVATGLACLDVDTDSVINRLESLIRDGIEPRITGVRMRTVCLSAGGAAIVIRIPRSWNPPHRVSVARSNRFYVRNSGGAHEASVEELRVLFTLATDVQTRIRSFRSDRLAMISAGRGPVVLSPRGRLFVHLISLSAFGQSAQIDLDMAHQIRPRFGPMDAKGTRSRFNLDGLINVSSDDERPGYTQVFRSGIVEATTSNILHEWRPNTVWPRELPSYTVCHAGAITSYITEVLPGYFEGLQALDVPPPIVVSVSFQGVMGAKLGVWGYDNRLDQIEPLPHVDPLLLPDVIVDDYGPPQDYDRMMRPIFDALWNAAGFSRCTYYNAEGNWQPPH